MYQKEQPLATHQYRCRGCGNLRTGTPHSRTTVRTPLGRLVDYSFCTSACNEYREADNAIYDHYQVCPNQDDGRDGPCSKCIVLHNERDDAKWRMGAAIAEFPG